VAERSEAGRGGGAYNPPLPAALSAASLSPEGERVVYLAFRIGPPQTGAMLFIVIGKDKGAGELRREERPAHLEFVADRQGLIHYAGPLLEGGRMVGSLFIFDVPDRAALDAYLAADPYFTRPIFKTIEIYESRRMVPEPRPGFLREEAERARAT
jgi:uncharacterized protein